MCSSVLFFNTSPHHYWRRIMSSTEMSTLDANLKDMQVRVEWFWTFYDFWNWAHCCRSDIFLEVHGKKFGNFLPSVCMPRKRREVFYLKKNQSDLKIIFLLKICKYLHFTSKNKCQKEYLEFNFVKYFFRPPKWIKLGLPIVKAQTIFL